MRSDMDPEWGPKPFEHQHDWLDIRILGKEDPEYQVCSVCEEKR